MTSFVINTLKMLTKDSPIFLQNINKIGRQLFLLFKKSTTFWDNPRSSFIFDWIFFIFAGNADNYKSVDEFEFGQNSAADFGLSCP